MSVSVSISKRKICIYIEDAPIATLVDLLIQIFKAPPTIKVVPKVIEALNLLLAIVILSKERYRLRLAEPRLTFEYSAKLLEKVRVRVLLGFDLLFGGNVFFEGFVVGVDGIELTATFGVGEDFHGFLNAFEECVVVGLAGCSGFFIGVVFEYFLSV